MEKALGEHLMIQAIPKGSIVYIRYKDHVLFRNIPQPTEDAAECEAVGWLFDETGDLLCIQTDRTIESLRYSSGKASGLVLMKNCILEIRVLPLQNTSRWPLISLNDITINAESALQNAKRKIQPK